MNEYPTESMDNDFVSTLLHEGFHLQVSSALRGLRISDYALGIAEARAVNLPHRGVRDDPTGSQLAKQVFGEECRLAVNM